ncbi:MAG: LysM peptidoglycan-binding domain-containing protein [Bacteroidetes bacterium]|nr:LysM peptidoglycan-binding domain-containing protein [Bacteroidota bacterium]
MKKIITTLLCLINISLFAQNEPVPTPIKMTVQQYIEKYSAIAIEEMFRSHIPASITLAQGILESGNGNSRLALEGNNHFGIKCKSWTGKTIYEDDDALQECFRKYDAVIDSYRDHSDFLMSGTRYAFLFDLDQKDYKSWALGLKKAGYATNPQYPELLIAFIEKHELQKFDETKLSDEEDKEIKEDKAQIVKSYGQEIIINEVPAITAKPNESLAQIALNYDIKVYQIYKYNDLDKNANCKEGDTLFIKSKKNKSYTDEYLIQSSETMHQLSQRFGIKLEKILDRNAISLGQEPANGEIIYFNKKRNTPLKLRDTSKVKDEIIIAQNDSNPKKIDTTVYNQTVYEDPLKNIETTEPSTENTLNYFDTLESLKKDLSFFHTVQKGETLFRISKKYNIRVDALQFLNNLNGTTLVVNQKLIINPNLPSADTKEPQVAPGYHTVRQGETIFSISKMYSISKSELKATNNLTSDTIKIGQQLVIISDKKLDDKPIKVESGSKPIEIKEEPKQIETVPEKPVKPSKPINLAKEHIYYTLKINEDIDHVCKKFNLSISQIKLLNKNFDIIHAKSGDEIRVK